MFRVYILNKSVLFWLCALFLGLFIFYYTMNISLVPIGKLSYNSSSEQLADSEIQNNVESAYLYEQKDNIEKPPEGKKFKILIMTRTNENFLRDKRWFGLGSQPFQQCAYSNCFTTNDYAEDYNSSDAVLFHMRHIVYFPKYRPPEQKWVMRIRESPMNEPNYAKYNGIFNVTWTYNEDSDIVSNYHDRKFVKIDKLDEEEISNTSWVFPKESNPGQATIVSFMSKCNRVSKRTEYIQNLQRYISVDIYGRCGNNRVCRSKIGSCNEQIRRQYRFYLSFENSICKDYVTEKIWRAIDTDLVPIVLGGARYSAFLPPHSYIDIKDFESPKHLAEYLKILNEDPEKYSEYFRWKSLYKIVPLPSAQCDLCKYLNESYKKVKVYDRLDLFWSTSDCLTPEQFYKNITKSAWIRLR